METTFLKNPDPTLHEKKNVRIRPDYHDFFRESGPDSHDFFRRVGSEIHETNRFLPPAVVPLSLVTLALENLGGVTKSPVFVLFKTPKNIKIGSRSWENDAFVSIFFSPKKNWLGQEMSSIFKRVGQL